VYCCSSGDVHRPAPLLLLVRRHQHRHWVEIDLCTQGERRTPKPKRGGGDQKLDCEGTTGHTAFEVKINVGGAGNKNRAGHGPTGTLEDGLQRTERGYKQAKGDGGRLGTRARVRPSNGTEDKAASEHGRLQFHRPGLLPRVIRQGSLDLASRASSGCDDVRAGRPSHLKPKHSHATTREEPVDEERQRNNGPAAGAQA